MPKAFISYAWESDAHKKWIKEFAERLRHDGIDVTLDQWHVAPGDQLTEFMERSIRDNDFVLIICTPHFKNKTEERTGGVGYEGDIMTAEVFTQRNQRKFIPILRGSEWAKSAPSWLLGKYYIDLRGTPYSEEQYQDLILTIHGKRIKAPPVGTSPMETTGAAINKAPASMPLANTNSDDIRIEGIIVDGVSIPKMDDSPGSALYKIPFKLSRTPSNLWEQAFLETWDHPPRYTTMHRPGIASVSGDRIFLDGTTIEEVEKFHRDTLKLSVEEANKIEKDTIRKQKEKQEKKEIKIREHINGVKDKAKHINFD